MTSSVEVIEDNSQLNENETNMDFATSEKQEARAFLRERFLRVITGIVGKQADFYLYENTRVSAEFRGCDVECLEVYTRNLETPLGKIPEAVLRTSDIIYMDMNDINVVQ
ncbi:gem-associated protein 7-like [Apis laboriosa]|uniref:gem-associated protein 7-like n=1 Tax=Apis dorsata TaxID=7462 RepID=UPI0003DF4C06|nr:gem-associated protein 7-like [Apis dorsata]XP_031369081.1 gem-associated protein 7-like [Apis dorsata]XP_043791447.1 gem-associated protein 7-like [Apis laboriosa]XP_043791448.1 gem-associated protein 7-like [Apis laboriosa]XP_043791449.1 gem-associated protein 7-like [Apis laboriosa]